jgi:hypothetical protein
MERQGFIAQNGNLDKSISAAEISHHTPMMQQYVQQTGVGV